jgi:hypothetical protein
MISTSRSQALTMLPLLFITSAIIVFFVSKAEPLFRLAQQKLDRLNTVLQENIAGAHSIRQPGHGGCHLGWRAAGHPWRASSTNLIHPRLPRLLCQNSCASMGKVGDLAFDDGFRTRSIGSGGYNGI